MKFKTNQRTGITSHSEREAPAGLPAGTPAAGNMGDAVTPHVLITDGPKDWRYLCAGYDTLDLGLYVDWGIHWYVHQPQLEYHRECTVKGEKKVWRHDIVGESIVRGSSKRNYRYHIQLHDQNIWLANMESPKQFPNVYVSPSAQSLWMDGPRAVIDGIVQMISEMGGNVMEVQISRADLTADFAIKEGLSLEFLRHCRVSRSRATNQYENDGTLETFYVAKKNAPVQARIYNKLKAILDRKHGDFMYPIWGGIAMGWRVEFQLRRKYLREREIVTLDDLLAKAGGLWTYLTEDWLSLRLQDSSNTKRRTVHPWWRAVQDVADQFGPVSAIGRGKQKPPMLDPAWYVSHMSGCLVSLAARRGHRRIEDALEDFATQAHAYWDGKSWNEAYDCKRIECQRMPNEEGGEDVPF